MQKIIIFWCSRSNLFETDYNLHKIRKWIESWLWKEERWRMKLISGHRAAGVCPDHLGLNRSRAWKCEQKYGDYYFLVFVKCQIYLGKKLELISWWPGMVASHVLLVNHLRLYICYSELKSLPLKVAKWRKNEWRMMKVDEWWRMDEGWMTKDEGWWFQALEGCCRQTD